MGLFGPSKAELQAEKDKVRALEGEKGLLDSSLVSKEKENQYLKEKYIKDMEDLKKEILFLKNADQNIKQNADKIIFSQTQIVTIMTRIKLNASASYVQMVDLYNRRKSMINTIKNKYDDCRPFSDKSRYFRTLKNEGMEDRHISYLKQKIEKQNYQNLQTLHAIINRVDELSKLLSSEQKLILDQKELLSALESHAKLNEIYTSYNTYPIITEEFANWLKKENPESDKIVGINKKIEELFQNLLSTCRGIIDGKSQRNYDFDLDLSRETLQYCGLEKEYNALKLELESFEKSLKSQMDYIIRETVETHKIEIEEHNIKEYTQLLGRTIMTKSESNIAKLKSINRNLNKN